MTCVLREEQLLAAADPVGGLEILYRGVLTGQVPLTSSGDLSCLRLLLEGLLHRAKLLPDPISFDCCCVPQRSGCDRLLLWRARLLPVARLLWRLLRLLLLLLAAELLPDAITFDCCCVP